MNRILIGCIVLFFGCKKQTNKMEHPINEETVVSTVSTVLTDDFELIKSDNSEVLLIVFPAGGSTSKETKADFKIVEKATEKGISVLLMNYGKLWIEEEDSRQLSELIKQAVKTNGINTNSVFIGGMSIGGTTALTFSNYLYETKASIQPQGVFVVDSPIDLYALYQSSKKDVLRTDFSEERLGEPKWIISYFEEQFGVKDSLLKNIQKVSPITMYTANLTNIQNLENQKIRFYTEPDTLWLKTVRQTDFESTNAYTIQKTAALLKEKNWPQVELIQTKNKGYRANGDKNPHSWSIVDVDNLLDWILE